MADLYGSLLLCLLLMLTIFFFLKRKTIKSTDPSPSSYPVLLTLLDVMKNKDRLPQRAAELVNSTPSLTFTFHLPFGLAEVVTANSANVQHMLKTNFHVFEKGEFLRYAARDFLGNGIFNVDGEEWKFQRQLASHEFNVKSLRKFLESIINVEISDRLIPILRAAAAADERVVLDFQDILQRFGFDNICKISFGHDPEYLSPALPKGKFAAAFETSTRVTAGRMTSLFPVFWKLKRFLNMGSEKELRTALSEVRDTAKKIVLQKKNELEAKSETDEEDLLSRLLRAGISDENLVIDMVICFILAGQDTTSAALTWFFWLLSKHPRVEAKILQEIKHNVSESSSSSSAYKDVKQLVYTHAAICESMRLYPPVPIDSRVACHDDVLPDGTFVKKGWFLTYSAYAMGRSEVWGEDRSEFRPERWLEKTVDGDNWRFVNKDSYAYPVFHAGPRTCLGKEMAFLQMKSVISTILPEFRVVPVAADGTEPKMLAIVTAKMKGGFPVMVVARAGNAPRTNSQHSYSSI